MLHAKDGTIVYVNRHQQPAYLDAAEVERSIQKYTRLLGEPAKISKLPRRAGAAEATIATWGRIELEPLDGDSIKLLADGKSPKKGFLLDYLGNLSRSAQDGLPIYRIQGGAGFAWVASFDAKGRGTLRLVAIDASALAPEPATTPPPASAGADEARPADQAAAASRQEPVVAAKSGNVRGGDVSGADADAIIARLESELSSLREQKAQAEEAARLARFEAEIARNEMAEAIKAAASGEITRSQQALVAPSHFADRETAVPIGAAVAAILFLGAWLGSRALRRRAERAASSDVDAPPERVEDVDTGSEPVEGVSSPSATDQATPGIDQDGLVRELGKQLGLEEVTAPSIADPLPDNSLEPASSQQESAAPPIAATIAQETPMIAAAGAPAQPSRPDAVTTV